MRNNLKCVTSELPWRDCSNDWNTETCRNPYEKPFNESCKMSDVKYPCSEVGAKYGDCEVGWLVVSSVNTTESSFQYLERSK